MQGGESRGRGLERGGGRNLRRAGSDRTQVVVRIGIIGVREHALDLLLAVVESAKLNRRRQRLDVRFVLDALGFEVLRFASPVGERFGCVRAPRRVLPGSGWASTSVQNLQDVGAGNEISPVASSGLLERYAARSPSGERRGSASRPRLDCPPRADLAPKASAEASTRGCACDHDP